MREELPWRRWRRTDGSARSPTTTARCCVLGAAGTGKTELLARRLARLADDGTAPERVLVIASTRATAQRLRDRVEALLEGPYEELWIGTWDAIGERLLREHSEAAGLDPFFDVLGPAERLAMLLDRLDELPLRRHEIRGNPAGLLARLLARIDALKAEGSARRRFGPRRRSARPRPATRPSARRRERELEFAELYAAHDRILAAAGSLDRGDVFLALNRLLIERADVGAAIAARFAHADGRRARGDDPRPAGDPRDARRPTTRTISTPWRTRARRARQARARLVPRASTPTATWSSSSSRFREPPVRFWRCSNERAQAQAVGARGRAPARRRHRPGGDLRPGRRPGRQGRRRSRRRWRSAASPSTSPGPPRSSSGPRCATRSPGCGCSPTPTTRRRRRGR